MIVCIGNSGNLRISSIISKQVSNTLNMKNNGLRAFKEDICTKITTRTKSTNSIPTETWESTRAKRIQDVEKHAIMLIKIITW